jgi:glycerol-3-phosphate dehydrogenase
LNMYDVMATPSLRNRRAERRAAGRRSRAGRDGAAGAADGAPAEELDAEWSPARHRVISAEEVVELLPALSRRELSGGYLFYDCQTDDVRLVLTVLGEAERFGAICVNRVEVSQLLLEDGRGTGVVARDRVSGEELAVPADNVVNATGVWADRLRPGELHGEAELPRIAPSRGTHVTLSREELPLVGGAIVPAGEGRSIFALPWLGRSLIGTTDNNYDGELDHVRPSAEDIEYLLEASNAFFGTSLRPEDLTGAYAGVRPLISTGDSRKSVDISRKAELYETSSGLITITGGKLTTWRRMAKLVVDRIVEREGREAPCRTHEIPLGQPAEPGSLSHSDLVAADGLQAMAARYGHAAEGVLSLVAERPELGDPILPGLPDLLAEAPFAVRNEQALTVGDVLLRRTRIGLLAGAEVSRTRSPAVAAVAAAMGAELGWSAQRVEVEALRFQEEALSEGLAPLEVMDEAGVAPAEGVA